jgi:hypothetical protein
MSRNEFDATEAAVSSLLPPPKIATYFNNEALEVREPLRTFPVTLQTVVADDQGHLCKRQRKTTVSIHEPRGGEVPMVYEMGIPIVETNDKWHYNVGQKVPLNLNRDNVPPAFLRTIRTAVLNETHDLVETEDANTAWAREGMASPDCSSEAVNAIVKSRFGDHVVSFDLHDREANKLAVSKGYTVVHGGQMSAAEWDNVRRAGAITDDPSAQAVRVTDDLDAPVVRGLIGRGEYRSVNEELDGVIRGLVTDPEAYQPVAEVVFRASTASTRRRAARASYRVPLACRAVAAPR